MRVMTLMVSKACVKSIATSAVLCGGLFLLKPATIGSIIECSAVVVECFFLKPCWCWYIGRCGLIIVRMVDSRILARGEGRAMGLYEVCWLGSLLGLMMGMIFAVFHEVGMIFEFMILFNRSVMIEMVWYDRCLIWIHF